MTVDRRPSTLRTVGIPIDSPLFAYGLLLGLLLPCLAIGAETHLAWFTDAQLADAAKSETPTVALPSVAGTSGQGVSLTSSSPMEWPTLQQRQGYISFWVRPKWNGDDGQLHRLLRIGDPASNGLLVEQPRRDAPLCHGQSRESHGLAQRRLRLAGRAVESSGGRLVLQWGSSVGLHVDRSCPVDGPIAGGCGSSIRRRWPTSALDRRSLVAGGFGRADLSRPLDAEGGWASWPGPPRFLRTAPYDAIRIDLRRSVPIGFAGGRRLREAFGVQARREGRWERSRIRGPVWALGILRRQAVHRVEQQRRLHRHRR